MTQRPEPQPGARQQVLFCPCGSLRLFCSGLCHPCYRQVSHSRRRFGGQREAVLARDGRCCVVCGNRPIRPHVHHRRPGRHHPRWLLTLCPRCHARIHKLVALDRCWVTPRLMELWAEQHPGAPLQLQLELGA